MLFSVLGLSTPFAAVLDESTEVVSQGSDEGPPRLPDLSAASSLEDYIAYAALNNPGLAAAFNRWKAAVEKIPQVRALPDPRLNYGYFIQEVETRVGPQEQRIGLSQMFPWFGKLKQRGNVMSEAASVAEAQFEATRLRIFDEVKRAYFELYYLGRAIEITTENIELVSYLEEVARVKYESGTALHGDVIKAQVELDQLRDRLSSFQNVATPSKARLNSLLNRPLNSEVSFPIYLIAESIGGSAEELAEVMLRENPELRGLDAAMSKEEQAILLAKKDYYPDITAGIDYVSTGATRMPGVEDSGKDPIMLGLSINIPIWRKKYDAGVAEARRNLRAVQSERRNRQNQLSTDLELVLFRLKDAERKIALYRDSLIPKADQNLRVTQRAYESGKVEFLSLMDSERQLLEFQLNFERARVDREEAISSLQRLTGTVVAHINSPKTD
ncbi:MAG: TolC family protein [Opitutaceae bacterium]